jgi:hypothetical protein
MIPVFAALMLATPAIQDRIVASVTGRGAVVTGHVEPATAPLQDRLAASITGTGLTYRPSPNPATDMQAAIAHAIVPSR